MSQTAPSSSTASAMNTTMTAGQSNITSSRASAPNLLDLPVELKINILCHLQPSEIQTFRQTCTHARDLVDEPSNANELYQASQARNLERLSQSVSRLSNLHGLTLLDALSIWIAQRGIPATPKMRVKFLNPLLRLWSAQRPISVSRKRKALTALGMLIDKMMRVHVEAHLNPREYAFDTLGGDYVTDEIFASKLLRNANWDGWPVKKNLKRYYIDEPTIVSWLREIRSDPSRLAGTVDPPQLKYPLEDLLHFTRREAIILHGHPGADLLDLPPVPESLVCFGFCVRTEHAIELLDLADERDKIRNRITEKEKAIILEQTYLY